jgi:hypothetical protein
VAEVVEQVMITSLLLVALVAEEAGEFVGDKYQQLTLQ